MVRTFNLVKNNIKELPNNIEAEQSVIGSILLSNEPATMSRERLYRRHGMGRVDPIGMQYSLVGPQRGARPEKFELFGGHLPGLFLDEISNKNTFPN